MKTRSKTQATLFSDNNGHIRDWVSIKLYGRPSLSKETCAAIGVMSNDRLIAGVTYFDYYRDHSTMQLGLASISPMWARKEIIAGLLAYPFIQCNVFKVWAIIATDNEKALKCVEHIGFDKEALIKHQFGPGKHGFVVQMTRPDFDRRYGNN